MEFFTQIRCLQDQLGMTDHTPLPLAHLPSTRACWIIWRQDLNDVVLWFASLFNWDDYLGT